VEECTIPLGSGSIYLGRKGHRKVPLVKFISAHFLGEGEVL